MPSLFDQTNNAQEETSQHSIDQWVGEDRKFKTDGDLAKGYANADAHIVNLENELRELKEKAQTNLSITEATKTQNEEKASTPANVNNLSEDELRDFIRKESELASTKNKKDVNMNKVTSYLEGRFGAQTIPETKRLMELNGFTAEQMNNLAETNPDFVINKIFGGAPSQANTSTIEANINTQFNNEEVQGHTYFAKMRKENPAKFHSKEGRKAFNDAVAKMGRTFLDH